MKKIKEVLKGICKDVIEQNNEKFKLFEGGISNHIFDEKGVQMKIGLSLIKELDLEKGKKLDLQFEKKFFNEKLGKKDYLDIYFYYKGKRIGIEIKFKTKGFSSDSEYSNEENYKRNKHFKHFFSNQGASTNGKYSFFWDLDRLNNFVDRGEIDEGYQIFITNDFYYWREKEKNDGLEYLFDGTKISDEKGLNNSDQFEMTHEKILTKKMVKPNWLSLDGIKGPSKTQKEKLTEKEQWEIYQKNLEDLEFKKKFLYCKHEIILKHVVDKKILWMPESVSHNGKSISNPATSSDRKDREEIFYNIPEIEYKNNRLERINKNKEKKKMNNKGFPKFAFIIIELKKSSKS